MDSDADEVRARRAQQRFGFETHFLNDRFGLFHGLDEIDGFPGDQNAGRQVISIRGVVGSLGGRSVVLEIFDAPVPLIEHRVADDAACVVPRPVNAAQDIEDLGAHRVVALRIDNG